MVNNDKGMNKSLKKSKTFQNINSSERLAKTVKIINVARVKPHVR